MLSQQAPVARRAAASSAPPCRCIRAACGARLAWRRRMNHRLLIAALALLLQHAGAHAALAVGDPAPAFEARASLAGKAFDYSLADALARGPVVVYFYPSAFTGGCNLEAHTFAVEQDKFAAAGATIVGVSLDD